MPRNRLITRTLHTAGGLSIRESGDAAPSRTITGYAILFGQRSAPLYEDEREVCYETISPRAVTREVLDASDIKMTLFHDRQLILARSKAGRGTLTYEVDEKGVRFAFDAPHTADGDKAIELVQRGDIDGCSFMFSTYYGDPAYVSRTTETVAGRAITDYVVNQVTGLYDFTLTPDPAYPDTSCDVGRRELTDLIAERVQMECREADDNDQRVREQVAAMRAAAAVL